MQCAELGTDERTDYKLLPLLVSPITAIMGRSTYLPKLVAPVNLSMNSRSSSFSPMIVEVEEIVVVFCVMIPSFFLPRHVFLPCPCFQKEPHLTLFYVCRSEMCVERIRYDPDTLRREGTVPTQSKRVRSIRFSLRSIHQ
jgi:hypothetical protein